jgi:hypothetical protein
MFRIVLSASRRTDIPAFYMPWFMDGIRKGSFEVTNPYNRQISCVPADREHVHSIVFNSKDFGAFLKNGYGEKLAQRGYGLFFNFTINSPHPRLEPRLPPLAERLAQLSELCGRFGPACIQWRFDPICHFETPAGTIESNLNRFDEIARKAAASGVESCIMSFVDLYAKVKKRVRVSGLNLHEPPLAQKVATTLNLQRRLAAVNLQLSLCCEKEVLAALPLFSPVKAAACIPVQRLAALYGHDISQRRDPGQRATAGCGCGVARDIGSYDRHPCYHDCLYCYANPSCDRPLRTTMAEKQASDSPLGKRVQGKF